MVKIGEVFVRLRVRSQHAGIFLNKKYGLNGYHRMKGAPLEAQNLINQNLAIKNVLNLKYFFRKIYILKL